MNWRDIYTGPPKGPTFNAHLLGLGGRTVRLSVLEEPAPPPRPERTPLGIITMTGSPSTPDGMAAWWTRGRNDADAVSDLLARMDALVAMGHRRIMLYMPAGWTWTNSMRTLPPSQWYSLPASRCDELRNRMPGWFVDNPQASLIIYTGFGIVDDPTHNSHRGMLTPDNGLDPEDVCHRGSMANNVRGWMMMAGDQWGGVMFDALSKWRDHAAPWASVLPYPIYGEAIPTLRTDDGGWAIDVDAITASGIPWLATDSFMRLCDPNREWTPPPGAELIVWAGQDRSDGAEAPDRDELQSWVDRGFTVASHREAWQQMIAELLKL